MLIMTLTGIVLMFKKQSDWIQPPTVKGSEKTPSLFFSTMLDSIKTVPEAEISSWKDIDRIDVRPNKGMAKVLLKKSKLEIQIDIASGKILQTAVRRSGIIEDLHTGALFGDWVKYGIFLTAAVIFFVQIITGIYLFFRPIIIKYKRKRLVIEEVLSVDMNN